MVAVVDRFFHTMVGSAASVFAVASMISVSLAMIGGVEGTGAAKAPAVQVIEPSGFRTAVPLPALAVGARKDMPSTGGMVTVTPAPTGAAVLLVRRAVIGKVSPGFTHPTDDTNE